MLLVLVAGRWPGERGMWTEAPESGHAHLKVCESRNGGGVGQAGKAGRERGGNL